MYEISIECILIFGESKSENRITIMAEVQELTNIFSKFRVHRSSYVLCSRKIIINGGIVFTSFHGLKNVHFFQKHFSVLNPKNKISEKIYAMSGMYIFVFYHGMM